MWNTKLLAKGKRVNREFAFISYSSPEEAGNAIRFMHGRYIEGLTKDRDGLTVQYEAQGVGKPPAQASQGQQQQQPGFVGPPPATQQHFLLQQLQQQQQQQQGALQLLMQQQQADQASGLEHIRDTQQQHGLGLQQGQPTSRLSSGSNVQLPERTQQSASPR